MYNLVKRLFWRNGQNIKFILDSINPGDFRCVKFDCLLAKLKVSKSRKQFMVSSILPKNEYRDNSMYWKLSQRSFFGRIEDTIICFRDCPTFSAQIIQSIRYYWISPQWQDGQVLFAKKTTRKNNESIKFNIFRKYHKLLKKFTQLLNLLMSGSCHIQHVEIVVELGIFVFF